MAPIVPKTPRYGPLLKQTGENIFDINPDLGFEHAGLRSVISAAQAWPISGSWGVTTFHSFPDLPKELQQKIWRFAAATQEARIINFFIIFGRIHCKGLTPPIMHACSDSRQEALFYYDELVFDGISTGVWVNWQRDNVFFDTALNLIKVFGPKPEYSIFQEKAHKIAMHLQPMEAIPMEMFAKSIKRFAKLEELVIVDSLGVSLFIPGVSHNYVKRFKKYPKMNLIVGNDWEIHLRDSKKKFKEQLVGIKIRLVQVVRYRSPAIMNNAEKEIARIKRQQEREIMERFKANETSARELQLEIDLRKIPVEVHETLLEDPDDEEDEYGYKMSIDGVFD